MLPTTQVEGGTDRDEEAGGTRTQDGHIRCDVLETYPTDPPHVDGLCSQHPGLSEMHFNEIEIGPVGTMGRRRQPRSTVEHAEEAVEFNLKRVIGISLIFEIHKTK